MTPEIAHILAVDDVADNLTLLQAILQGEGYAVSLANSGYSALNAIETLRPDLVLLDLMMPDLDGYEVVSRVRQTQAIVDTPILLVSAHNVIGIQRGMALGANDFISMPFEIDELLAKVKYLLQQRYQSLQASA